MTIEILQLLPGARAARGWVVVIDVFRAFSTACYVLANGAREVVAVGSLDKARELKEAWPNAILMGERGGVACPGFDYGNSPTEILKVDFQGRRVIQTTSAGTQGLVAVGAVEGLVTGAFVNARAVEQFLRKVQAEQVSLVCMGNGAIEPSTEDTACAEWLRAGLLGEERDFAEVRGRLTGSLEAQRFLHAEKRISPAEDFHHCLALDRFDFVVRADRAGVGEGVVLRREDV